jgi:hypothetical protein
VIVPTVMQTVRRIVTADDPATVNAPPVRPSGAGTRRQSRDGRDNDAEIIW